MDDIALHVMDSHVDPEAVRAMASVHSGDLCVVAVVGGTPPLHVRLGSLFEVS